MSEFPPPVPPAPQPWSYSSTPVAEADPAPVSIGGDGTGGDVPPPATAPVPRPKPARPTTLRTAVEWVVIIAVAIIGAVLMRTFLIQAFYIPSESMVPTLQKGDRVLVNKLSYRLHPVHRGDVVVFAHSPNFDPAFKDLIKRVIGLPGETVSGHDGHVYIDGHLLNEPYLPAGTLTTDFTAYVVPPHRYWVMGDNRNNSTDSRVFKAIAAHQIVGRAFVLWWPLSRIHLL